MSVRSCRIKKDDKVRIVAGKEKGKIGKVLKVFHERQRVLVENVNFVKRHARPGGKTPRGGIIEKEAPIHVSNAMLMCDKCINAIRVKMQRLEDGRKVRMCGKCGEIIDK